MKIRNYDKLTLNLPQLQDRIKKDKESYKNEFLIQLEHFYSMLDMFKLNPSMNLKNFSQLILFMAHTAQCYTDELKKFPSDLQDILKTYSTVIHPDIRFSICKALILLRNKNLLSSIDLLSIFFDLLLCQDKQLREFLKIHIVNDVKKINLKQKDLKKNTIIQQYIFNKLREKNVTTGKSSIDIMIQLYKKNIWNGAKVVNKISECCFSKHTKIMVAALSFFTGNVEEKDQNQDDTDSESEPEDKTKIIRKVLSSNKVNKKTRRRKKILEKTSKAIKQDKHKNKAARFNFSALHLIYDPQEFADRLLRQLEKSTERYEVKLLMIDLISRLIGVHQLMVLNFYSFIQRYLQPHQKDVTKILLYVSQASHELVLPDIMENIIKHIAFNFITERNSSECMTVGLNAVREICTRCPLAISSELLQDFSDYKKYKNRNVAMAAKSLIQLYRVTNPDLLKKGDRGRKTIAINELKTKEYGESNAANYIPGVELLDKVDSDFDSDNDLDVCESLKKNINNKFDKDNDDDEIDDDDDDDDDVNSKKEIENETENKNLIKEEKIIDEIDNSKKTNKTDENLIKENNFNEFTKEKKFSEKKNDLNLIKEQSNNLNESLKKQSEKCQNKSNFRRSKQESKIEKNNNDGKLELLKEIASEICNTKILDQEEFEKLKSIRIAKQVKAAKSANTKRKNDLNLLEDDLLNKKELVSLSSIERLYKRPKLNKNIEQDENISKGKKKKIRGEWRQNEKASKTEKERQRNKAFMMIKHKVNKRKKQSFRFKQLKIKAALIKQLKAKKL